MKQSERLRAEDLLARWKRSQEIQWEGGKTPEKCTGEGCVTPAFATGDVVFVYGDLDSAIARKEHLCARCGMGKAFDNIPPSATLLYVEEQHMAVRMSKLPQEVRRLVVEGFEIIDKIHRGVEENLRRILEERKVLEQALGKKPS